MTYRRRSGPSEWAKLSSNSQFRTKVISTQSSGSALQGLFMEGSGSGCGVVFGHAICSRDICRVSGQATRASAAWSQLDAHKCGLTNECPALIRAMICHLSDITLRSSNNEKIYGVAKRRNCSIILEYQVLRGSICSLTTDVLFRLNFWWLNERCWRWTAGVARSISTSPAWFAKYSTNTLRAEKPAFYNERGLVINLLVGCKGRWGEVGCRRPQSGGVPKNSCLPSTQNANKTSALLNDERVCNNKRFRFSTIT